MNTRIYFIRHGEWNDIRGKLSPEGEKQARTAGSLLAKRGVTAENSRLFTSPAERAVATAELIAEEAHLNSPEVVSWLAEDAGFYGLVVAGIFALMNRGERRHLVLVGHAPVFEEYLEGLLKWQGLLKKGEEVWPRNGDVYEVDVDTQKVEKLG